MNIILGPPGTGKTTYLLGKVEELINQGMEPKDIGYLAFTRKAAREARERAMKKFELGHSDLPYFRTIHSLAFMCLGLQRTQIMQPDNYQEIGKLIGTPVTGRWSMEAGDSHGYRKGDRYLFFENLARVRGVTIDEVLTDAGEDWNPAEVEHWARTVASYKGQRHVVDYTDLLDQFSRAERVPKFKALFVDEGQDLSARQWAVVDRLVDDTGGSHSFVAGDDDQAIFRWAGADVERFIEARGRVTVLHQSYRTPGKVQAEANRVIGRVAHRRPKQWNPRQHQGSVELLGDLDQVDMSEGTWLVLARNTYLLNRAEEYCREQGIFYSIHHQPSFDISRLRLIQRYEKFRQSGEVAQLDDLAEFASLSTRLEGPARPSTFAQTGWPDDIWHKAFDVIGADERLYLVACLRRGERVLAEPRVVLSTIHGAKGGEADNVVLFLDVAKKTYEWIHRSYEDECRVFYVAVTRAKERLFIVQPNSSRYFDL